MATPKILLIDDDVAVRTFLRRTLEHSQFDVIDAACGRAGLELANVRRPDAVVCDLRMPGLNGLETLRRLRASPLMNSVPAILISAAPEEDTERQAGELNARFLGKPFLSSDLVKLVRQALAGTM